MILIRSQKHKDRHSTKYINDN